MAFRWAPYYNSFPKETKIDILKDIIQAEWKRRSDPEVGRDVRIFLQDLVQDLRDEMLLPTT